MLNNYVWNIYLESGGRNLVDFFEKNFTACLSKDYSSKIKSLHQAYCADKEIVQETYDDLVELQEIVNDEFNDNQELNDYYTNEEVLLTKSDLTCEDLLKVFDVLLSDIATENKISDDKELLILFSNYMEFFTTSFALDYPNLFIPYYFRYNFNVLEMIAQEFDITLPKLPLKKDYLDRIYYYVDICYSLLKFRIKNKLTTFELYAFLYDFAPKYIGGIDSYIIKNLPEAKGAYLIGGNKNDRYLSYEENILTVWQCNKDTRPGDMLVMYLTYPISAIDSIWRSISAGFDDPFFFYYHCTYMGHCKRINNISLNTLKMDSKLGNLSIVRKNMQGVNGFELNPSDYNYLIDISKESIQKIKCVNFKFENSIHVEKDVENILIKPFLKKLGYKDSDYSQQFTVPVGNHNSLLIPDFVLLPRVKNGHYSAFAVIEAKLNIQNVNELNFAKNQVRSYAKQLGAKYSLVADINSIWIMESKDDYEHIILNETWSSVYDINIFRKIEKILNK